MTNPHSALYKTSVTIPRDMLTKAISMAPTKKTLLKKQDHFQQHADIYITLNAYATATKLNLSLPLSPQAFGATAISMTVRELEKVTSDGYNFGRAHDKDIEPFLKLLEDIADLRIGRVVNGVMEEQGFNFLEALVKDSTSKTNFRIEYFFRCLAFIQLQVDMDLLSPQSFMDIGETYCAKLVQDVRDYRNSKTI